MLYFNYYSTCYILIITMYVTLLLLHYMLYYNYYSICYTIIIIVYAIL